MGYFKHESAYIDEGAIIGNDTKHRRGVQYRTKCGNIA